MPEGSKEHDGFGWGVWLLNVRFLSVPEIRIIITTFRMKTRHDAYVGNRVYLAGELEDNRAMKTPSLTVCGSN